MKQFRVLFVMMMLMISAVMTAQTTVKGVLTDENLGEAEPFATVRVFKQGKTDKPVAMFLTKEDGSFSQQVKGKGRYDIVFSSVGKEDLKQTITLNNQGTLDLGTLLIKENATMLKGVEIVAQKPLVKMDVDKMSYNVAEDEDAKSNTVLDMLRKVPMVTVDGQDNITVNGSSSFKVYVDGMPNVMFNSNPSMVFKSMPATAVKSIEVVTNPGAKYDAEGAGGVLNIIMNKQNPQAAQSMNGYNGTVRASGGNKSISGGAFISGQQGKLSYSANVMTTYSKPGTTDTEMEITQNNPNGTSQLMTSSNKVTIPFTMGNLTLGYQIDSVSALNVTASINSLNIKSDGNSTTTMGGGSYGKGFSYGSSTDMRNSRTSFSGSIDYQRFFNNEHTQSLALTYQLNYSPSTVKSDNIFNTTSSIIDLTNRYSENKEKTTDHTFQIDYTMPIATGQTLSFGTKLQLRDATSDAKYYKKGVYDPTSSMDYEYKNSILAGYGEYAGNFGKIGAKAGLRYEQTWQNVEYHLGNGDDFSLDYGNFVPAASIQYNLSMLSNIGLSYNVRISRPGITYLNPYVDTTDPTSWSYGNTDLDTETAHNINLVYNFYNPTVMLNATLRHTFSNDGISQYSFFDADNVLNTTYGNILKSSTTGINIFANLNLGKKTRIMLNSSVSYSDLRSDERGLSNYGWSSNIFGGVQQTLPWDLRLSLNGMYATSNVSLDGSRTGMSLAMGGLTKTFLNDRLSIGINGVLPISSELGKMVMESNTAGKDYINYSKNTINMGQITLNISFTFGKNKAAGAKKTRKTISNDDLIDRSNGTEEMNSYMNM